MSAQMTRQEALGRLRGALAVRKPGLVKMIEAGPVVRARFQPIFKPENLPKLTKEDFQSFLVWRNNQHWVGLHRKGPEICSDMKRLRGALAVLLDEARPIQQRLDDLRGDGRAAVSGMGRAVLTAILLVMFPDKYGVWNNRSQGSMEELGLWPEFDRGETFGRRYAKVNDVLLDLTREVGTDLWTLDGLWWAVLAEEPEAEAGESSEAIALPVDADDDTQRFGLERHLHDFLRDNWEKTSLGREWDLHVEDGEVVGYEYPTPIGRIDLLARHKKEKAWLVVELKRNQSSDDTVGQATRYMGYVREQVAGKDDRVDGLIIAHAGDEKIRYALSMIPSVSLMLYEVDFRLKRPGEKGRGE
jgi:hypothetical protein